MTNKYESTMGRLVRFTRDNFIVEHVAEADHAKDGVTFISKITFRPVPSHLNMRTVVNHI